MTLGSQVNSLPESTTGARVKVATVTVTDTDGYGENNLSVTGPDAADFEVDHNGLYLKSGIALNAASASSTRSCASRSCRSWSAIAAP